MNQSFHISGNIADLVKGEIFKGTVYIENGRILKIIKEEVSEDHYIIPGFIDAHIHIESSMLIPSEFARIAVIHGTVATVSDPHEIGNVLGINGIEYMIENGKKVPFKFNFGASSCVPATTFETAGATLGTDEIDFLLQMNEIKYLSEMMNWPGVLFGDKEVEEKIALAKKYNKPVDGHAPGVMGDDARKYIEAGITTDHECFTKPEALNKLKYGMKILIREGSAAKNFEALVDLIADFPDMLMFCSDDRHPNDLVNEHINSHVVRAVAKGYDPLTVLRIASYNPVKHYSLDSGLLQPGDDADFIVVDNLKKFNVLSTYIRGIKVAEDGNTLIDRVPAETPNKFNRNTIKVNDLQIVPQDGKIKVIEALDGQLITNSIDLIPHIISDNVVSDTEKDILKLTVVNRYSDAAPALAFIKNFGLKSGAIASSVAHDSHNIVAVGVSDKDIVRAVNLLVESRGGVALVNDVEEFVVPLPVAGLMSNRDGFEIAKAYDEIDKKAKALGSELHAPYMTLSFMALLVIPELKLSDQGLFDGKNFEFTQLFC